MAIFTVHIRVAVRIVGLRHFEDHSFDFSTLLLFLLSNYHWAMAGAYSELSINHQSAIQKISSGIRVLILKLLLP
jgi:hypothetical protein